MRKLFEPMQLRDVVLKNRIVIPPMAMYQAGPDGRATDWHLVHYGRLAMGGASMVMLESTAIEADGRIGHACIGLYEDGHVEPLRRIAELIRAEGSVAAIQINHTGRKGSWRRPWDGYTFLDQEDIDLRGEHPWPVAGPSPVPVKEGRGDPQEMDTADIRANIAAWAEAARRADRAGFDVLEIHAAHGYLINQFLSPISNRRQDHYGGSLQRRMRFALEVAEAVGDAWPAHKPLLVRISAVDGVEGGWSLDDSVELSRELALRGVDAIDCSSGGIGGLATVSRVPRGPGFQLSFSERIRHEVGIPTIGVGLIRTPDHAAEAIDEGRADIIAIGREALVNPNFPSAARTQLDPERGYQDWAPAVGWWLDKRDSSLRART